MPNEPGLPLIRGRIQREEPFQSPRGGGGDRVPAAVRNPAGHRDRLLRSLDVVVERSLERQPTRDPAAAREMIAVHGREGAILETDPLADKRSDVRAVSYDPQRGIVLLDTPDVALSHLRRKIGRYGDDEARTPGGRRWHEDAIAPIGELELATDSDLAGSRVLSAALSPDDVRWFEVACRGGRRRPIAETDNSREQILRQLAQLGCDLPKEFLATEHIVFFVRCSIAVLRQLIEAVDCIYEFDLATPEIRDWLHAESPPTRELREFTLDRPPAEAPAVVVMDTGIASRHPLLESAILSAASVDPFDASPEDADGHGTEMAGTVVYADLGRAVDEGGATASHWLQSVKLLRTPQQGAAHESQRPYWPAQTESAVAAAEGQGGTRPRCFALAVTSDSNDLAPTFWSHAVDLLAFNDGAGRLIVVSAGNADFDVPLIDAYPQMHLEQKIHEPAQAVNALTVGALTYRTALPPDPDLAAFKPVAPAGGVSPYTSAGSIGQSLVKPDVVFEGGNLGFDGSLPTTMETMSGLTTAHTFLQHPLTWHWGTSEATARAARLAASIWQATPDLRPETVRGLVVHAAAWTSTMIAQFKDIDERLAICGYGVPDELFARECAAERATIVVEDEMPNAIEEEVPRKNAPKRAGTPATETRYRRIVKFFRLPIPEDALLDLNDTEVQLRVTLSYLPEPNIERRRGYNGLDLRWDMQGPQESEDQFRERINKLLRPDAPSEGRQKPKSFPWDVGIERRSRGTVQSDRWHGAASVLAGEKLVAVYPALGWWERRAALRTASMRFALIVSVVVPGLEIYAPIRAAVEAAVEVQV